MKELDKDLKRMKTENNGREQRLRRLRHDVERRRENLSEWENSIENEVEDLEEEEKKGGTHRKRPCIGEERMKTASKDRESPRGKRNSRSRDRRGRTSKSGERGDWTNPLFTHN